VIETNLPKRPNRATTRDVKNILTSAILSLVN